MKRIAVAGVAAVFGIVGLSWGLGHTLLHNTDPLTESGTAAASAYQATSGGYVVNIDPSTGEFLSEPIKTSRLDLPVRVVPGDEFVEEAAPGGGIMIRVDERLDIHMSARLDAGGSVSALCGETHPNHHEERK